MWTKMFLLLLIKSQFCNSGDTQPYDWDQDTVFWVVFFCLFLVFCLFFLILTFGITLFDITYIHICG